MPSQLILRFQYQRIQKLRLQHLLAGTQIEIISMEQRWRGQLREEGELDLSTLTDEAWIAYFCGSNKACTSTRFTKPSIW
ncbi:hypothetical protein BDZ91DRAFT_822710 [Kalaharituber pfeilii]|nr:hypothetical protein BDZ91DRAFT_822710 [Kalaharituber pfeilii]